MTPATKVYILRGILGLIASTICVALNLTGSLGLAVGIFLYGLSFPIMKHVLKLTPSDFRGPEEIYFNGLAPFLALWIIPWVILYNFLYAPTP
ncbi:MAG: hypothetical protein DRJ26_05300 [Candidatus Methanomethylicota archaeon]|uniref:Phosphatidate cytidylyltransferase n=1 Tax=Thermoproteota archaeon TaxID=2056631 RepID=A0A497EZ04_9CREN|nr:MAG: hypothetical protein DRJ26_05300 [Candidatus Verstraetearchaeota archaeon]